MKRPYRLTLKAAVAAALISAPPSFVSAEDIDLFVGNGPTTTQNPNVLFILDNTSNWTAANQNWPGGVKQGQSELRALKKVIGTLNDKVNVGLMLFTENTPSTDRVKGGGYVRYAIRPMTDPNKSALQQILGDETCTYSATNLNTLNGTPNCIYGNFDKTEDMIPASNGNYSAVMFEAFKYFGGWTFPADAKASPQYAFSPGNPQGPLDFGPFRYGGDLSKASFVARLDAAAYKTQWSDYNPPISDTNNCANNYIIFVGNGFVNPTETPADKALMTRVKGDTTHLSMQQFSTTTTTVNSDIGYWCGTGNNQNNRRSACTTDFNSNTAAATLKASNPADSYACVGNQISEPTFCVPPLPSGANARKFLVQATKSTTATAPTGVTLANPTNPDNPENMPDEWAKYLFTTDVNAAVGVQNVKTYAVDVFKDQPSAAQNSLLFNMAKNGGGESQYFQAKNENELELAFNRILTEIQSVNSVFAAASLPVSATNRAQNENQVFFGMFRPDELARPRWYGNLKRYQIVESGGTVILAGQDPTVNAVNNTTGFFFDCTKSFWTVDSGTYWNFSGAGSNCPLPATPPPSSVYSDLPDGSLVEKGGAAQMLRNSTLASRNVLSCANDGTTVDCSSLVGFADGTASITAAAFGTPVLTSTERTALINYTRGQNVKDERSDGNTTQTRPTIHGDVVHSRPLPVNYGLASDTSGTKVAVFYGTNDGVLRAVSTNTGQELWSFVAPEHHSRLKRLYDNNQLIAYPNVLAAAADAAAAGTPMTPAPARKDYFFDGTVGLLQSVDNSKIWIFPSMRRGGRMLYAFDVSPSDPSNPQPQTTPILKWRIGCPNLDNDTACTSDMSDIGQTWSVPNVAFVKNFSTTVPVIVVGGGYDNCEDTDAKITTECASAKGRKVYVLNADTGAVIRSFSTDRSVPSDITLVDADFDSYVDYAYVADTGGNLYRLSLTGADKDAWSMSKIASTASGGGRKFLFPPAALAAKDSSGNKVIFLTLGSGDRERPLLTNYPVTAPVTNRFYMLMDKFAGGVVDLDSAELQDNTGVASPACITEASTVKGWRLDMRGDPAGDAKVGEQVVTSSLIAEGKVFWNTSRATSAAAGTCESDLGEARGYNAGLLCGNVISTTYAGGGLPISPVLGSVTLQPSGRQVTVCIGCANDPGQTSPFTPGQIKPVISPVRKRLYWQRSGDK